jgi:hypothetical protein
MNMTNDLKERARACFYSDNRHLALSAADIMILRNALFAQENYLAKDAVQKIERICDEFDASKAKIQSELRKQLNFSDSKYILQYLICGLQYQAELWRYKPLVRNFVLRVYNAMGAFLNRPRKIDYMPSFGEFANNKNVFGAVLVSLKERPTTKIPQRASSTSAAIK